MSTPAAPPLRPTPTGGDRLRPPWRRLLRQALLLGLRPARLPHLPRIAAPASGRGRLTAMTLPGSRGQRLANWLFEPEQLPVQPAPVLVALHGWGANASTLAGLVDPMLDAGWAVVLLDASCHGESGQEDFASLPRFAEDLSTAIAALSGRPAIDTTRVAVLGHSVGAAAALLHAARQGGVRAVVSLAAFAHPRDVMNRWLAGHRLPSRWLGPLVIDEVEQTIGEPFDRIAPLLNAPAIDCPVLLVHGRHDTEVPPQDAERLLAALRLGRLLMVDGGHDLRADLAEHRGALLAFLRAAVGPSPATRAA